MADLSLVPVEKLADELDRWLS